MDTLFALLAICAGNSPVTGAFPTPKSVTRSFDVFFTCSWIHGWVNNRDAGDLRRHRDGYDVTVIDKNTFDYAKLSTVKKGLQPRYNLWSHLDKCGVIQYVVS